MEKDDIIYQARFFGSVTACTMYNNVVLLRMNVTEIFQKDGQTLYYDEHRRYTSDLYVFSGSLPYRPMVFSLRYGDRIGSDNGCKYPPILDSVFFHIVPGDRLELCITKTKNPHADPQQNKVSLIREPMYVVDYKVKNKTIQACDDVGRFLQDDTMKIIQM